MAITSADLAGTGFIEDLAGKRRTAGAKLVYRDVRISFAKGAEELVHICANAVKNHPSLFLCLCFQLALAFRRRRF